jgi:hypothetical protein
MNDARPRAIQPGYGNGFDALAGLTPVGTSHRWHRTMRGIAAPKGNRRS